MVNPKLRFKADDGTEFPDYQSVLLISLADVRDGTHDSPKYHSQGFPFVTSKNLTDNGKIDFSNVNLISENDYNNINKRSKVDVGDILFGLIGTIGRPVIVEADGFAIKNVALIKPNHNAVNNQYIYHLMCSSSFNNQLRDSMTGGNQKFVSLSMLRSMRVTVPTFEEQRKIADFLSTFDSKVEANEQQLEALQETKKGLLQQIFSQQLRFKADDGTEFPEWECCDFGDVADGFNYGLGASAKEFDGLNTYIRITDIDDDSRLFKIDGRMSPSQLLEKGLVQKNDILMARTGSVGKTFIYSGGLDPLYFAGYLIRIRVKEAFCPKFIFYTTLSSKFIKWVSIESSRSVQPGLNAEQYRSYRFSCPCFEEQRKIAEFLGAFDEKIEVVKRQLEALRDIKKGLLQQMFV